MSPEDVIGLITFNYLGNFGGPGGLAAFIGTLWTTVIIVAGLAFLVYFLVGGLQWLTSGGDKIALESARGKITNALIGLVIIVSSFAVIKIVEVVLGIDITDLNWPTPF
jgi:hypothetical protein